MPYSQVTTDERQEICRMAREGLSQRQIARSLGRAPSTLSREIRRNTCSHHGGYCCEVADHRARQRRQAANQGRRKLDGTSLGEEVRSRLGQTHSPEQIAGRLAMDFPDDPQMRASYETTYQFIFEKAADGDPIYEDMRRPRRKRKKRRSKASDGRGKIPGCVNIEHRPKVVDDRSRCGDWESDTVHGAAGHGGLATHVERQSGYLATSKLDNLQAETFSEVTIGKLQDFPPELLLTMTCDNGKEFALFKAIEQALGIATFFADPHSPWQRGANENTNGLLRQFFPKGTDFRNVTDAQVAEAEHLLNNRPRKRLNYRTPAEVMAEILSRHRGVALRN